MKNEVIHIGGALLGLVIVPGSTLSEYINAGGPDERSDRIRSIKLLWERIQQYKSGDYSVEVFRTPTCIYLGKQLLEMNLLNEDLREIYDDKLLTAMDDLDRYQEQEPEYKERVKFSHSRMRSINLYTSFMKFIREGKTYVQAYEETAEVHGLSPDTVKRDIARFKRLLAANTSSIKK